MMGRSSTGVNHKWLRAEDLRDRYGYSPDRCVYCGAIRLNLGGGYQSAVATPVLKRAPTCTRTGQGGE